MEQRRLAVPVTDLEDGEAAGASTSTAIVTFWESRHAFAGGVFLARSEVRGEGESEGEEEREEDSADVHGCGRGL